MLDSGVVEGVWVFQALHWNMLSCVWVWVLALGREQVRCRIFCKIRGVGSLMALGVVVSVGIGRVTYISGGVGRDWLVCVGWG